MAFIIIQIIGKHQDTETQFFGFVCLQFAWTKRVFEYLYIQYLQCALLLWAECNSAVSTGNTTTGDLIFIL